jgi:hypothetical protein
MKDLTAKLERLLSEAAECDLIANLATDPDKRAAFERMARHYRTMVEELRADIAKLSAKTNNP